MGSIYKHFDGEDIISNRTLLHESIPLTGSIVSGTYSDNNIKDFARFQQVYDYPYLSSSANHVFDITIGYHADSVLSATTTTANENDKKIQMYNQMAQILMGHDATGTIQKFDQDGNLADGGTKYNELIFINFSRLLYKDEIKKGSFSLTVGTGTNASPNNSRNTLTDTGAANDFRVNSPAGEYGILKDTGSVSRGLIFYQAGIACIDPKVYTTNGTFTSSGLNALQQMASGSITGTADLVRRRFYDCSFNNTTELNSTIYFCRVNAQDFNYSTNPTYVSGSKIQIKNNKTDAPAAYITTVNLHSSDNAVMARAKVSEPLKSAPDASLTLRVRTDW